MRSAVGYFYDNLSDALQSALDLLLTFNNEQGVEAFYDQIPGVCGSPSMCSTALRDWRHQCVHGRNQVEDPLSVTDDL
jgi:hypothetical protein